MPPCLLAKALLRNRPRTVVAHPLRYPRSAAHLLSDVASFLISLFAVWLASRPATMSATWGYHRVEIFGALLSVVLIWFLTGILCFEAVQRVLHPEPVDGPIMFATATGGLVVNLLMMKILHQGHDHGHGGHSHGGKGHSHGGHDEDNINVHAAFIHVVGDLVQSIGVMIAAGIIWRYPDAHIADPICTFLFSILVLFTTVGILRDASYTLLNSVPSSVSLLNLANELYAIPGVANVHDLHVWSYGQGRVALTAHIIADDPEAALAAAQLVTSRQGIRHSTLQVERCGSVAVSGCETANSLAEDCSIDLAGATPQAHAHSHGGGDCSESPRLPLVLVRASTSVLGRASVGARHVGADGTDHAISPTGVAHAAAAPRFAGPFAPVPKVKVAEGGGHGHSHGGEAVGQYGHGHSHGQSGDGAHGHSH